MPPTVVLTGAAGFLGSHLLETLLRFTPFEVIAVDSLRHNGVSLNVRDVLEQVPQHAGRVKFITHDLRAPFGRTDLRHLVNVDYIVHAAAYSQVGHSITDPVGFVENNVRGALTMLEVARLSPKLSRFVLISTDEVYGPNDSAHDTGELRYRPSSPYAASKACQELLAQSYRSTFQVPLTIFNISNMFGPRQSQLAFTPQVIRKLREGSKIDVHVDESGNPGGRHYSFVRDVAHHITHRVYGDAHGYESLPTQVAVPGHEYVNNDDLVRTLHRVSLITTPADHLIKYVDVRTERPSHDINYARLPGDTGWTPFTPTDDAYRQTWDWYQEHPEWLES